MDGWKSGREERRRVEKDGEGKKREEKDGEGKWWEGGVRPWLVAGLVFWPVAA